MILAAPPAASVDGLSGILKQGVPATNEYLIFVCKAKS